MNKKTKKKFTVPEFKTWLTGIMQFQNKDWSPNREQWEEIYSKIMDLKEPVNREKLSLTDSALDEINNIVYYHITDALKEKISQQLQQPQPHTQPIMGQQTPIPNPNPNPNLQPDSNLANVSLSELKKQAEEKASAIGSQQSSHKLPDQIESNIIPEDYV